MSSLSKEQKDLLLDFYFKCGSEEDLIKASELIGSNPEAAVLFANLENTLDIMDQYRDDACPNYLVEATMLKFREITAPKTPLERLIEAQRRQTRVLVSNPWRSLGRIAAMAAMVAIIVAIYLPTTAQMRRTAWKTTCGRNMSYISEGLAGYANDNAGSLPLVDRAGNNPWWKIGAQQGPNQSNTRGLWLLVKGDYAKLEQFLCPGNPENPSKQLKTINISDYEYDFPGSEFVNYSFRLLNEQCNPNKMNGNVILAADENPMFEAQKGAQVDQFRRFRVTDEMLRTASRNHARKGQNILFRDGSVNFSSGRKFMDDDIYTVRNEVEYTGCEEPSCVNDVFLVP